MALTPPRAVPEQPAALSQRGLFDQLVGIFSKHVNEQLAGVTTRLRDALLDVSSPSLDARDVFMRVKSGNLLKENAYAFQHLTSTTLERILRKEVDLLLPRPKNALSTDGVLSLVPFEEMDDKVAFDAISRPFELQYATQLATLNVRLGYLLNRDTLRIGQNPFRPEVLLSVINSVWKEFEPNTDAHGLLVPLLKPALLWDLAPMYEAACEILLKKGTKSGPDDKEGLRKSDAANAAKAKRARQQASLAKQLRQFLADEPAGSGFDADIPLIPDLPQMGGTGGGWRPSGATGFAAPPTAPGAAETPLHSVAPAPVMPAGGFASAPQAGQFHGHAGPVMGMQAGAGYQGGAPGGGHAVHGHPTGQGQPFHAYAGGQFAGSDIGTALGQAGYGATPAPLLDMLRTLQARMPEQFAATPSAHAGGAAGAVAQGDPFFLPRLKAGLPKGSLSRGDESTIDLLSKVFDTVFLDPNIPPEARELIKFLQIPVLKAALVDKNFFFEEAHPARRMIDLMSRVGMEQRPVDDPVFQAMQRSVDKVGREADDASVFANAVADLEATIKEDEGVAAQAMAAPIAAALKQEKVVAATRNAKTAVAARVSSGEVVAVLETFLEKKWTSVLTVAYSVEDDKPGAVGNATRTMDDLIWSVKPKITHEQRRSLIAKLPGLLATLNKWLDIIQWKDAERLQFFAELAECHASIVRAPLDITPERQLEIAVEVAQEDAMRRLQKEHEAAAAADVVPVDDAQVTVETLERGMWMEFVQSDASVRKAKLAWVSPLRTLFIFSLGGRQESFSLSAEKLAVGIRLEKVKVLRVDSVVERALADAMGGGAVNDDSVANVA